MRRIGLVVIAGLTALLAGLSLAAQSKPDAVTVYKDPTCECCAKWVEHLQQRGFVATVIETADVEAVKRKNGVPPAGWSCHTALVGGYVIEGHVPAADVRRLLEERPAGVIGLTVPAMPIGAPGMEMPGGRVDPYNVVAFDKEGRGRVIATYGR